MVLLLPMYHVIQHVHLLRQHVTLVAHWHHAPADALQLRVHVIMDVPQRRLPAIAVAPLPVQHVPRVVKARMILHILIILQIIQPILQALIIILIVVLFLIFGKIKVAERLII